MGQAVERKPDAGAVVVDAAQDHRAAELTPEAEELVTAQPVHGDDAVVEPRRRCRRHERARERDVPVIALKVGRTEDSKAMVTAHSGALAGEHGAYEALFDAYGVHEVLTLEEMADAMELFSSPRRVSGGSGIVALFDSGGERALFVDRAHDLALVSRAVYTVVLVGLMAAAIERVSSLVPLTPGGAGFAEIGTIAWLVANSLDPVEVVAGVLVYRFFLIALEVPLGGLLLGVWAWFQRSPRTPLGTAR